MGQGSSKLEFGLLLFPEFRRSKYILDFWIKSLSLTSSLHIANYRHFKLAIIWFYDLRDVEGMSERCFYYFTVFPFPQDKHQIDTYSYLNSHFQDLRGC